MDMKTTKVPKMLYRLKSEADFLVEPGFSGRFRA